MENDAKTSPKAGQVARALRAYLQQTGKTQAEAAKELDLDESAFSRLVNGKAGEPCFRTINRLHSVLEPVGYYRSARYSRTDFLLGGKDLTAVRVKEYGLPAVVSYYYDGKEVDADFYATRLEGMREEFATVEALP